MKSDAPIRLSSNVARLDRQRHWAPVPVHPIVIHPQVGKVTMRTNLANESDLQMTQSGAIAISLLLEGDTWAEEVGVAGSDANIQIIRGLTSSSEEPSSWNRIAQETLAFLAASSQVLRRISDVELEIDVPYISGYEIESVDNVSVTLPGAAVATNRTTLGNYFLISPTPGNCTLAGTLLSNPEESAIRTTGSTLILQLVADRWREGVGPTGLDDATARQILSSIVSDQTEPYGWTQVVRPDLLSGDLVGKILKLSPTLVQISLPPYEAYQISEIETLSVRLPGEVLQSLRRLDVAVVASPPLQIKPTPASSSCGFERGGNGVLELPMVHESALRSACALHIQLHGDTWASDVGNGDTPATRALLAALRSQSEHVDGDHWGFGWDSLVRLTPGNVSKPAVWRGVAMNDTRVIVQLPGLANYDISAPEVVAIALPSVALRSGRSSRAPDLVILAAAGTLRTEGSLQRDAVDAQVRAPGASPLYVDIVLEDDAFVASLGLDSAATNSFLAAVQVSSSSGSPSATGFDAVVRPLLSRHSLLRLNESALRFRLPAAPAYELAAGETLVLNLNASDEGYLPVTTSGQLYFAQLGVISPGPPRLLSMRGDLLTQMTQLQLRREPIDMVELPVLNVSLAAGFAFKLPFNNESELVLTQSVRALSSEPSGWNEAIRPHIRIVAISNSPALVSFAVPPNPPYAIRQSETVIVSIPNELLDYHGASYHGAGEPLNPSPPNPSIPSMPL